MSVIGKAIIINNKKQTTLDGKNFSFTGNYTVKPASYYNLNGDYEVLALRSSGDLIFDSDIVADIFMVGGGAGGIYQRFADKMWSGGTTTITNDHGTGLARGGAGYNLFLTSYNLTSGEIYNMTVGANGTRRWGMGTSTSLGNTGNPGKSTQFLNTVLNETHEAAGGKGGIIDFDNYTCTDGEGGTPVTAFKEEGAKLYANMAEGNAVNSTGDGAGPGLYDGGSGVILIRLS